MDPRSFGTLASRVKSCNCESVGVRAECDSESELGFAQLMSFVFGQLRRMDGSGHPICACVANGDRARFFKR